MAPNTGVVPDPVLSLPVMVASPVDIGRLIRELEQIDNVLLQVSLRADASDFKMPRTSHLMDMIVQLNKINLLEPAHRALLQRFLSAIRANAPVLHISFSTDPSPVFVEKLMVWLRLEIHPEVLLTIGLQPTIGAGCVVRTNNKYFDFSLRQNFANKRHILQEMLITPEPAA